MRMCVCVWGGRPGTGRVRPAGERGGEVSRGGGGEAWQKEGVGIMV